MQNTGTLKVSTPTHLEIVMTRAFDAPRRLVWDAVTKPDLVRRWMFTPPGWTWSECEMDVRVGGKFCWAWNGPDGRVALSIWGEHREVDPPAKIVHTERMEMGPGAGGAGSDCENAEPWELLATTELVEQGGKTHLKMTLLFPTKEGRDAALASGMEHGVAAGYDTLDALLVDARRTTAGATRNKVTPFLMFNDQLEAAIEFYTATFPDSEIKNIARNGKNGPVSSAEFVVGGQFFMGFNGGPHFSFSEGFSLFVDCNDQAEVDEYWDKFLRAGAKPTQCGWITDQFGLTWQIVPRRFMELIGDKDAKKVKAVIDAMMQMVKLDVATLERAYAEA